jgi:hypothetical protein
VKTQNRVQLQQPLPTPPSTTPSSTGLARAYASADPRFNMKQYDRAGVSRGRGQKAQAGIKAAQNFSQGIASVYDDQLQRQAQNANAMLGLQQGQEQYAQALGGLQSQAAYADQMAALQRQGILYGLLGDVLG